MKLSVFLKKIKNKKSKKQPLWLVAIVVFLWIPSTLYAHRNLYEMGEYETIHDALAQCSIDYQAWYLAKYGAVADPSWGCVDRGGSYTHVHYFDTSQIHYHSYRYYYKKYSAVNTLSSEVNLGTPKFCPSGNPINHATGNKIQEENLSIYSGQYPLTLGLMYNSYGKGSTAVGPGWTHHYDRSIILTKVFDASNYPVLPKSSEYNSPGDACLSGWNELKAKSLHPTSTVIYDSATNSCRIVSDEDGTTVATIDIIARTKYAGGATAKTTARQELIIKRPDGKSLIFYPEGSGVWSNDNNIKERVESLLDEVGNIIGWRFHTAIDEVETYNANGQLLSIESPQGYKQTLVYDEQQRLVSVNTNVGHSLIYGYDTLGRIESLQDHSGRVWSFQYDLNNNLAIISYPDATPEDSVDNPTRQYHYENQTYVNYLTGITDERGIRYANYEYDGEGRGVASYHGPQTEVLTDRIDGVSISYNTDGSRDITNSRGGVTNFQMKTLNNQIYEAESTGPICYSGANSNMFKQYDNSGNLVRLSKDGVTTEFGVYDLKGNPGFEIKAVGTPEQRRVDYTYDTRFHNKVATITESSVINGQLKITTYAYDDLGNVSSITLSGSAPDGQGGFAPVSRTTMFKYNGPLNQLSEVDGPRPNATVNDVTQITYYPNDISEGNNRAKIKQIIGPEGLVLRDNIQYSTTGKVTSETRPNGVSITYTYYSGNDRLESVTEAANAVSRTTRWSYLSTGEVETITQAYGTLLATTITLGYDAARRLTSMTDQLGNKVEYTLDSEGNRVVENIKDASNLLYRTVQQTFDIYNQLDTRTLIDDITDFNYAPNGLLDTQTDAKNISTDYNYDSLKRLTSVTGDFGGTDLNTQDTLTQYVYDVADRLTKVITPNDAATEYIYDDLGNLLKETSPDRGSRTYTHDEAGNVITITDARGITVTYSYDGLNRVTNIDYPGTEEDVTMIYDICTNGVGQLCQISDQSGTTDYVYSAFGNITDHIKTEVGVTYTSHYEYNILNRVLQTTTPTGRAIDYGYDSLNRITHIDANMNDVPYIIAHNAVYRADGLLTGFEFGNGFVDKRMYNLKGQLTNATIPSSQRTELPSTAVYDFVKIENSKTVQVTILSNDIYTRLSDVNLSLATPASYGSAVVNPDKTISFTPKVDFAGFDAFTYQLQENHYKSVATVLIEVIDADLDNDGLLNSVDADNDNDGMLDEWEIQFGLNPGDPNDALLDSDGDGRNNLAEYEAGLDPTVVDDLVEWTDLVAVSTSAGSISKTGNSAGFDAGASSLQNIEGDGGVEYPAYYNFNNVMIGLSSTNADATYQSIEYALYAWDGRVDAFESGNSLGRVASFQEGDVLGIERIGATIYYKLNGNVIRVSSKSSTGPLIVDASIFLPDFTVNGVKIYGGTVSPSQNIDSDSDGIIDSFDMDDDNDGILDDWETQFGLNPGDPNDALLDSDGDGRNNLAEYEAGLDPTVVDDLVEWTDLVAVSTSAGSISKTGNSAGFDAGASSLQNIEGDGGVEYPAYYNFNNVMIGLSSTNADATYQSIEYALYAWDGRVDAFESGNSLGRVASFQEGDVLGIERIGATIYYKLNGNVIRVSSKSSTGPLIVDASIFLPDFTVNGVKIYGASTNVNTAGLLRNSATLRNIALNSQQINVVNNAKSQLMVVNLGKLDSRYNQFSIYRKGPETNHQWLQTAEDPNAYDRPDTVYYVTRDSLSKWQPVNTNDLLSNKKTSINASQQVAVHDHIKYDNSALIAKLASNDTATAIDGFINVNHGTPSSPIAIDSEVWSYVYDSNGNVDSITASDGSIVYTYDALNRLTEDTRPAHSTETIDYDRNGNRTGKTIDAITDTYNYLANSNTLDTDPAGQITHDPAGNRTRDQGGNRSFEYNNAGRLWKVYTGGQLTATYTYNAQGQRTRKVTSSGTTVYHYDLNGTLLSETTETGAPLRDYVHMNGVPVAQIDTDGTIDTLSYLHTDHLGTPRRATNEAGEVVWSWDSDAFGQSAANDDADSDGNSAIINLRFAGQYFDDETNLYYNYFRYYDPSSGRYITSDPIGLLGGLNTYGYVGGNPLSYFDPLGLRQFSQAETAAILGDVRQSNLVMSSLHLTITGKWDFATNLQYRFDTFTIGDQTLSPSEFGNYVAGYAGAFHGGGFGIYGALWGGIYFDLVEHGIYSDFDQADQPFIFDGAIQGTIDANEGADNCLP